MAAVGEELGRFWYTLALDSKQFNQGFQDSTKTLTGFVATANTSDATMKRLATGVTQVDRAQSAALGNIQKLTQSFNLQAQTFGMSSREASIYAAKLEAVKHAVPLEEIKALNQALGQLQGLEKESANKAVAADRREFIAKSKEERRRELQQRADEYVQIQQAALEKVQQQEVASDQVRAARQEQIQAQNQARQQKVIADANALSAAYFTKQEEMEKVLAGASEAATQRKARARERDFNASEAALRAQVSLAQQFATDPEKNKAAALDLLDRAYRRNMLTLKEYERNVDLVNRGQGLAAMNMRGLAGDSARATFAVQQLAFGLQDATSVYGIAGFSGAVRAASNNVIQFGSLMDPTGKVGIALALAAVPIGLLADHFASVERNAKGAGDNVKYFGDAFQSLPKGLGEINVQKIRERHEMEDLEPDKPEGIETFIKRKKRERQILQAELTADEGALKGLKEKARRYQNDIYSVIEESGILVNKREGDITPFERERTRNTTGMDPQLVKREGKDSDKLEQVIEEQNRKREEILQKRAALERAGVDQKTAQDFLPESYLESLRTEQKMIRESIEDHKSLADAKKINKMEEAGFSKEIIAQAEVIAKQNQVLRDEVKIRDILKGYKEDVAKLKDEEANIRGVTHARELHIQSMKEFQSLGSAEKNEFLNRARAADLETNAIKNQIAAKREVLALEDRGRQLELEIRGIRGLRRGEDPNSQYARDKVNIGKLAAGGAPAQTIADAEARAKANEALRKERDLFEDARKVAEKFQDPATKLREEQARLNEMFAKGALKTDEYRRALAALHLETKTFGLESSGFQIGSARTNAFLADYQERLQAGLVPGLPGGPLGMGDQSQPKWAKNWQQRQLRDKRLKAAERESEKRLWELGLGKRDVNLGEPEMDIPNISGDADKTNDTNALLTPKGDNSDKMLMALEKIVENTDADKGTKVVLKPVGIV